MDAKENYLHRHRLCCLTQQSHSHTCQWMNISFVRWSLIVIPRASRFMAILWKRYLAELCLRDNGLPTTRESDIKHPIAMNYICQATSPCTCSLFKHNGGLESCRITISALTKLSTYFHIGHKALKDTNFVISESVDTM
jgi:hypothetical protein